MPPAESRFEFDEIGYWSEIKLDIVKDYASAYSKILAAQIKPALHHIYVDAFAGAGVHISKATGQYVTGSPVNALLVQPPFLEYHLIDIDQKKIVSLHELTKGRQDVHIHQGNCNAILLEKIFPNIQWEQYRRGLCLLDPYGLHLDWKVVETAGKMRTIDMFLNFPVADMNRNVLWHHPKGVAPADLNRMNAFWGDDSWRNAAYRQEVDLFGSHEEKTTNEDIVEAYRKRLKDVAGFKFVPQPMPMRNSTGATIYYLFFASPNATGGRIVEDIFERYRQRGIR
jgi:three-Cys-motif partner protein